MKSSSVRSLDTVVLGAMIILGVAMCFQLVLLPHIASAAAVTLTTITATSTPAYVNTGFATTTRAKTGDTVQYQLTLSGTPLIAPQINIFNMGSTTMSGGAAAWFYATTTTAVWTEGPVTFQASFGGTTGAEATTTVTQTNLTGTNVTYDKTGPILNSVTWTDVDGSTQFSGGDILLLTWGETMATTTLTGANLNTVLALTNSHTFSTTTAPTWNTAGTQLTITLGTATTITGADTIKPTSAVKDAVGNADATVSATTLPDTTPSNSPTGLADSNFHGSISVTLTSIGSSQIRYTTDGTTPTCSSGTVYSSAITLSLSTTLKAVGCDEASNLSSVVTAVYSRSVWGSRNRGSVTVVPVTPSTVDTTDTSVVSAPPDTTTTTIVPTTPDTTNTTGTVSRVAPAISASSLSSMQIQSILDVLTSFEADAATIAKVKASLEGTNAGSVTSAAAPVFKANLTIGSLGNEVKALQLFLNAHGYSVTSSGPGSKGNETVNFGPATKAALIKYQKAKGIMPASGYFGPKTRASINSGE